MGKRGREAKGKRPKKKRVKKKKATYYKVQEGKANREKRSCPKCGAGVFMAEHKNRVGCGKCGYTEWRTGGH